MIDGNLIWRGTPSFADGGMIPQAAKNVDPSKSLSGTTGGVAFEAHILEVEGTAAKAIEAPIQNGRRGFLPRNPDGDQNTPVEAGSDGTNSSETATQNSVSPSDDALNSSLLSELYGNAGHTLTANGALQLGAGILPKSLASKSPTAPTIVDGGRWRKTSGVAQNADRLANSKTPTQESVFSRSDPRELQEFARDRGTIELARERVTRIIAGEANSTATSGMTEKFSEVLETPGLSSSTSPDAFVDMTGKSNLGATKSSSDATVNDMPPIEVTADALIARNGNTDFVPVAEMIPVQNEGGPNKAGQSQWAHESSKTTGETRNRFTQKRTEGVGSRGASVMPAWAGGANQTPAQSQMTLSISDTNSDRENEKSELVPIRNLSPKMDKVERKTSRDHMMGTREKEGVPSLAPTSPIDNAVIIVARNQDSAAISFGSNLSLSTAETADEKHRDGDIRSDEADGDGAVASNARTMRDLSGQNFSQRNVAAQADITNGIESAHAARPREDRGTASSDATELSVNVIDIAGQAQNGGPDAGSDRRADKNATASTLQSLSTNEREQSTAAPTDDASPRDDRAASAASSDQPVAVPGSAAKVDLALIADAASVGLSVIGQSTSLAPPVASSLVQQIANPILAASRAIATGTEMTLPATGAVKTLEIRLVPENLGNVVVKMRLAGDALQVQLEADHQGTLRLLMDNKDVLSQSIQSSGYKLDAMTLQTTSGDTGSMGGQGSQGHRFESQSPPQGSGSSLGSSQQGENRTRDQSQLGKGREGSTGETSDGYAQESDRDRRSDSIYV